MPHEVVPDVHEIPLQQPLFDNSEIEAAAGVIAAQSGVGAGRVCTRIEGELETMLHVRHALLTTSGSHALEIAMMALDLGPGDEVILPSFTFSSCGNAIVLRGATPVFVDVQPRLMTIAPDDVERKLTQKTKAIMPVHYAGMACEMGRLLEISQESGVPLIEDAAQAVFAKYQDSYLGTMGLAGCLSFHHTKNLSCGEGGALLTNDDALAAKVEVIREKGTNRSAFLRGEADKYTWIRSGSSYVLSDILAAILGQQLAKRERIQAARAERWRYYRARMVALEQAGLLELPDTPPNATPNYHLFCVFAKSATVRDRVIGKLRAQGIGAAFHYVPLHSSPYGRRLCSAPESLPVTEDYAARLIRLPLYPALSREQSDRVVAALIDAVTERI